MKNEVKKSRHMETKIIDGYTVKIYVEECLVYAKILDIKLSNKETKIETLKG